MNIFQWNVKFMGQMELFLSKKINKTIEKTLAINRFLETSLVVVSFKVA